MTRPSYQKIALYFSCTCGFFKRLAALLTETRELVHEIHDEEHTILWKW